MSQKLKNIDNPFGGGKLEDGCLEINDLNSGFRVEIYWNGISYRMKGSDTRNNKIDKTFNNIKDVEKFLKDEHSLFYH